MRTIPVGWFPSSWTWAEGMGYDETIYDVNERVRLSEKLPIISDTQQDAHVQRWEDYKASEVLQWLQMQRWEQEHGV